MPLVVGARLGPYEIVGPLGAGGMGEVYRARDSRLGRDVAVKVLPESVAGDPERRARFEREAQTVAALSHPNVLAIFDTGSHDGQLYAVTELLEGETLRERLQGGALPVRKAVEWAVQIALGLDAAHAKQLVHRDLKPENVFLLDDGRLKILDFGLARQAPSSGGATESFAALTDAGTVLGTVGYMAPEQVRAQPTDGRTDLFALGAVLYEMLTGQRAFRRDTPAETLTAILREEPPDLARSRADVPPALERIVRHCLEKNPQERFQTARDVAFALETLSESGSTIVGGPATNNVGARATRRPTRALAVAAIGVVGLVALGLAISKWRLLGESGIDGAPPVAIGTATQVTADDGLEIDPALSPDGKLLAYAAGKATQMRIFIRPVAGSRTLTLSEGGAAFEYRPRWSPDGSQILFLTPDGASIASALGGTSQRVASAPLDSAAWSPDGKQVLIARAGALTVAEADGSGERPLTSGSYQLHSCDWSPRNDWVACASGNLNGVKPGQGFGNIAPSTIVVASATGGPFIDVTDGKSSNVSPAWSPDGRHLYFVSNRDGPRDLYVLDVPGDGRIQGAPRRVTTGLGVQSVAFSANGEWLAYVTYAARANIWSIPIPSGGAVDTSRAQAITASTQIVESLRVSRDRSWLIYDSTLNTNADIFRMPIAGGPAERLTTDPADDFAPDLSPDGHATAYHSWKSGSRDIYVKPLDGGPLQTLTATPAQESYPIWSPDGSAIAFVAQTRVVSGTALGELFVMHRGPGGEWGAPVSLRNGVGTNGSWLPDGHALAFPHDDALEVIPSEPGAPRVVYAPAPGSTDPPVRSVVASEDGRTLYFKSVDTEGGPTIWAVPAAGGKRQLLVRFADPSRASIRPDFAAGAGRFFFTLEDRQADIWVAKITRR